MVNIALLTTEKITLLFDVCKAAMNRKFRGDMGSSQGTELEVKKTTALFRDLQSGIRGFLIECPSRNVDLLWTGTR